MDGINPEVATATARNALREAVSGRPLEVWVEVRDAGTGEAIYGYRACRAEVDDEVTIVHKIGDFEVSAS